MAHILVEEDEVPIREVVSRHLLLVGHTVAQAGTGPQAVEMLSLIHISEPTRP